MFIAKSYKYTSLPVQIVDPPPSPLLLVSCAVLCCVIVPDQATKPSQHVNVGGYGGQEERRKTCSQLLLN